MRSNKSCFFLKYDHVTQSYNKPRVSGNSTQGSEVTNSATHSCSMHLSMMLWYCNQVRR